MVINGWWSIRSNINNCRSLISKFWLGLRKSCRSHLKRRQLSWPRWRCNSAIFAKRKPLIPQSPMLSATPHLVKILKIKIRFLLFFFFFGGEVCHNSQCHYYYHHPDVGFLGAVKSCRYKWSTSLSGSFSFSTCSKVFPPVQCVCSFP